MMPYRLCLIGAMGATACDRQGSAISEHDSGAVAAHACGADAEPVHRGEATYYVAADGSGNCSFPATPTDVMVGAMNRTDYRASASCGACAEIVGPLGRVTVRVVDQCPECAPGDVDLSPQAFDRVAARASGRVAITWQYVPCLVDGSVRYHFKEGSSQWWTAVQVRAHRHAIATFEVERDGAFVTVPRETYNYFVASSGMGPGPYIFRLTDVHGGQIIERGVPLRDGEEVGGSQQFPSCGAPD